MEENEMIKAIKEKAKQGDVNAKIALAINKVKYEGKLQEGIEELLKLSNENEVACHNLIRVVLALREENYYSETFITCKKLAEEEKEIALIDLGAIYQLGVLDTSKNIEKAIECFEKAIKLYRSGIAYQSIGAIYYYGKDIKQDLGKAFEYFEMGAKVGYADSEDAIAQMYLNGQYVEQDYNKAIYWYEKAFEHGKRIVAICMGNLYLPDNNVLNNEKKAFEWYSKGGECDVPECLVMEGYLLENGSDNVKNLEKAIDCYERAAKLGSPNAYFLLGIAYMEGKIVTKNTIIARKNLEKALELGIEDARTFINKLNRNQGAKAVSDTYTSVGAYLPETTTAEMYRAKQEAKMQEEARREKNREMLKAVAATSGASGFIDDRIGCFIDENGNETYIDADSGYIFNDTTGDISFYDKNTHSVYNTDSKEFTYLDIRDGYVYNFNTGKTTLVSGSTTLGS